MKIQLAALARLRTNSTAMFEFPAEWGEFDFTDTNEQIRACELIMSETGAMWIPVAYASAHNAEQVDEFRDAVIAKCNFPPCDVPAFDPPNEWEQ